MKLVAVTKDGKTLDLYQIGCKVGIPINAQTFDIGSVFMENGNSIRISSGLPDKNGREILAGDKARGINENNVGILPNGTRFTGIACYDGNSFFLLVFLYDGHGIRLKKDVVTLTPELAARMEVVGD